MRYSWPDENTRKEMQVKETFHHSANAVTYMHDKIGLHRIANLTDKPAISLHLYTPAFDTCATFEEGTGKKRQCGKCTFYTINGEKVERTYSTTSSNDEAGIISTVTDITTL
ncbi:cysteine dioxygenase [Synchytrium microbalum]|uniref:Cysteine dioxygenase n=1 Tax=Synchytrium microbalum TaxID=1806994 RepID=A0A507BXP7_9FUNG|nr:cysteine dioxygenase [Synchytrium microbalum]TPX30125.1 cysteine dioxygenase [Synchytrium microbalum]